MGIVNITTNAFYTKHSQRNLVDSVSSKGSDINFVISRVFSTISLGIHFFIRMHRHQFLQLIDCVYLVELFSRRQKLKFGLHFLSWTIYEQ